jgi:hypothetical protein
MMKDLYRRLENIDLALLSLLNIGIYLTFKNIYMEAMRDTLEHRLPYLMLSAKDFSESFVDNKFQLVSVLPPILFSMRLFCKFLANFLAHL